MWWRFLIFCVLVTIILFLVLSSIHGRPVTHFFFHRCCEDNIENDKIIFEDFGNTNTLRERLISEDILFLDNSSFVTNEEVNEVIDIMRQKLNVHDPKSRINLTLIEILHNEVSDEENSGEYTTKKAIIEVKSERLTDIRHKTNEDNNEKKYNTKDAIEKLDTLFGKKAGDAIRDLDLIVNENKDPDPIASELKVTTEYIETFTKYLTEMTTEAESESVKPEIKVAPPLDEMIMSEMHDSNDSSGF